MIGYDNADAMYIWLSGTVPQWRRQGVFNVLLDNLIHEAARRGHTAVTVKSYKRFQPMLNALRFSGFENVKTENDAIYLIKYLKPSVT
jgi:GNAT superfamily N-acetyltransferase